MNAWFDQWPRARVRVGAAIIPAYLACGLTGVGAGAIVVLLLAVWTGQSVAIAAAVNAIACVTFLIFSLIRWWITGVQKIVLLEQFLIVELAAYAVLALAGIPPLVYVDLLTAGLSTFLIFGRIGCFVSGCCYGFESPFGVSYPHECGHRSRARRFPLQLVEAGAWTIFAIGSALASIAGKPEGTALTFVLVGYGALRLMLEPLRGDPRAKFLGLTEGGWLAVLSLGAGAWLHDRSLATSAVALVGSAIFAAAAAIAIPATRRWWLALAFTGEERANIERAADHLREAQLGEAPVVREAGDLIFAASRVAREDGQTALNISVSSRVRKLDLAEASLMLEWLTRGLGINASEVRPVEGKSGVFLATLTSS